jgi:hypothetical protein
LNDCPIGKHVEVDHKTVSVVRRELEMTWEIPQSTIRTGLDGRMINTSRIGSSNTLQQYDLIYKMFIQCRYFENDYCVSCGERLPFDVVCEHFAVIVVESL